MKHLKLFLLLFLLPCLLLSCKAKGERTVATTQGFEISYDEMRYVISGCKDEMSELYGTDIWSTEESNSAYLAELQERVDDVLQENYATLLACKDFLPDLSIDSKEVTNQIQSNIDTAIDSFDSKSDYKEFLKSGYMTEKVLKKMLGITIMQMNLEEEICKNTFAQDTDSFTAYLEGGNFCKVKKVTLLTDITTATVYYEAKDWSKIPAYAEFSAAEYYFRGLANTELEEALFSLAAVGDATALEKCEGGYCFYIRVEDEKEIVLEYQLSDVLKKYREKFLQETLETYKEKIQIDYTQDFSLLDYME